MQSDFEYRMSLVYAVCGSMGWLGVAMYQWSRRVYFIDGAADAANRGNGEIARQALDRAGAHTSEVIIALLLVLVFAFNTVVLYRQNWNGWDWATAITGIATVASLIFLCAAGRGIYAAPFTLVPMWLLLYRPGVKQACGVGETVRNTAAGEDDEATTDVIDIRQEQELLTGLRQSLRVFEVERGMETDVFVSRYTRGLEDDDADNEEWFALARLARRAEERIAAAANGLPSTVG